MAEALAPRATPFARAARFRLSLDTIVLAATATLIGYLVLTPIAFLVISSFRRYQLDGSIGFVFTLDNYAETVLNPEIPTAAFNSIVYAVGGTLLAILFGTALAWVVERTN